MVYKSLMRTARSSKVQLLPERYTADLANELRQRDKDPIDQMSTTVAYRGGGEAPHRYAYRLWHQGRGLLDICIRMGDRINPQRETVAMFVVFTLLTGTLLNLPSSHIMHALTEDPALPFSMSVLISLMRLDSFSWVNYRDTIERWTREGRGAESQVARC